MNQTMLSILDKELTKRGIKHSYTGWENLALTYSPFAWYNSREQIVVYKDDKRLWDAVMNDGCIEVADGNLDMLCNFNSVDLLLEYLESDGDINWNGIKYYY